MDFNFTYYKNEYPRCKRKILVEVAFEGDEPPKAPPVTTCAKCLYLSTDLESNDPEAYQDLKESKG